MCFLVPLQQAVLDSGVLLLVIRLLTAAPGALPAAAAKPATHRLSALTVLLALCQPETSSIAPRVCQLCSQLGVVPASLAALDLDSEGISGPGDHARQLLTYATAVRLSCWLGSMFFAADEACLDRRGCLFSLMAAHDVLVVMCKGDGQKGGQASFNDPRVDKDVPAYALIRVSDLVCAGLVRSSRLRQQAVDGGLEVIAAQYLWNYVADFQRDWLPDRALCACKALEQLVVDFSEAMLGALDNRKAVVHLWGYLGHVVDSGTDPAAVQVAMGVVAAQMGFSLAALEHASQHPNLQLLCRVLTQREGSSCTTRALAARMLAVLVQCEPHRQNDAVDERAWRMYAARAIDALLEARAAGSLVALLRETVAEGSRCSSIAAARVAEPGGLRRYEAGWPDWLCLLNLLWQLVSILNPQRVTAALLAAGLKGALLEVSEQWLVAVGDSAPSRNVQLGTLTAIRTLAHCHQALAVEDLRIVPLAVTLAWLPDAEHEDILPVASAALRLLLVKLEYVDSDHEAVVRFLHASGCLACVYFVLQRAALEAALPEGSPWHEWVVHVDLVLQILSQVHRIHRASGMGSEANLPAGTMPLLHSAWVRRLEPMLKSVSARVDGECRAARPRDVVTAHERQVVLLLGPLIDYVARVVNDAAERVDLLQLGTGSRITSVALSRGVSKLLVDLKGSKVADKFETRTTYISCCLRHADFVRWMLDDSDDETGPCHADPATKADAKAAALLQEEEVGQARRQAAARRAASKKDKKKRAKLVASMQQTGGAASEADALAGAAADVPEGRRGHALPGPCGADGAAGCALHEDDLREPPASSSSGSSASADPAAAAAEARAGSRSSPAAQEPASAPRDTAPGEGAAHAVAALLNSAPRPTPPEPHEPHQAPCSPGADCGGLDEDLFCCPITHEVMADPVILADGFTYERSAITRWLARHGSSPMTNQALPDKHLVPNLAVRQAIAAMQQIAVL